MTGGDSWPYPRGDRDWPTYLHWWAAGDELPDRTPDWVFNLWPSRPLHWLVCRIWSHVLYRDHTYGFEHCIWCQYSSDEPVPDTGAEP